MIIDAHVHLWDRQNGLVNGKPVYSVGNGKSRFGDEVRQMMPPYMTDGSNRAEVLFSNMDYAGVDACVVTQEQIDGNQDAYLAASAIQYPERMRVTCLYEEGEACRTRLTPSYLDSFHGIKICAGRLSDPDLTHHAWVFEMAHRCGKFISIDLAPGDIQTGSLGELAHSFPDLKIAIGHFGMVNRPHWHSQIRLARFANVYVESGGITWLFHREFYPYSSAVRAILEAGEICSFDKLMWGSDYPRTMTAITYRMSLDFVAQSKEIAQSDKEKFLGTNAAGFYGLHVPSAPPRILNMVDD